MINTSIFLDFSRVLYRKNWATGLAKLAPVRGVTAYVSCPAVFVMTAWFVVLHVLIAWVRAGLLGLGVDGQQGLRGIPR